MFCCKVTALKLKFSVTMNHTQILEFYKLLPKTLRQKIQKYHKSKRPNNRCAECYDKLYEFQLSDELTCAQGGRICKLCKKFGWRESGWDPESESE